RVCRRQARGVLLEGADIGQERDALPRRDAEGIAALRTDAPGALDLRAIHDLLAGVTLDPQPLGGHARPAARTVVALRAPEPRHQRLPAGTPTRGRKGAFSAATSSPTSFTSDGEPARSSMSRTMAEPTTTPSASLPMAS